MVAWIFGHRYYGKVDASDGEYAVTRFFHIDFLPLFPEHSFWVSRDGLERAGHDLRFHVKSIAATYLRVWAPLIAAIVGIAHPSFDTGIAAGVLLLASAWSWTWRSLRGDRALRRADLHGKAFGSRCDPRHLEPDRRAAAKHQLELRWAARDGARTPDDVARLGPADEDEAALAHGLLRLAGDHARADRIVDGRYESADPEAGGPYRAAASAPRAWQPSARTRLRTNRVVQLLGLLVVSAVVAVGADEAYRTNRPAPLDVAGLATGAQLGRAVTVPCEDVRTELTMEADDVEYLALCEVGDAALPVLATQPVTGGGEFVGMLGRTSGEEPWAGHLDGDVALHEHVYLDMTTGDEDRVVLGLVSALGLGVLIGWTLYLGRAVRDRRRRRRRAAA